MAITKNFFTVRDAAKKLGVTDSRVRQLCIEHDLGEMVGPMRLLSPSDMRRLESLPRTIGRPPKGEKKFRKPA